MDKEIKIAGKKIFYRVYGTGKPVMLVHGFGETGDVWKHQVDFLKDTLPACRAGFQLIVPDLPGSGLSDMINDMSMEGMAETLKTILDKEIQPSAESSKASPFRGGLVGLIGHSMGGYIMLAFVKKYSASLSAFGLFHSTAYPDTEEKKITRRKGIEFIREHGAFEFLKNTTPNLFAPATKQHSPELVNSFINSLEKFSAEALIAYYESMIKRPDCVAVLKNASVPVLFIMGEHDNAVPMQDVLKQCPLPERSFIHILHQSGHMGMLEEKEKANHILQQFLSSI